MKRLASFYKRLRLSQLLVVFLAGVILFVGTGCSGASNQGANPNNPAVQAGGMNNPHKGGGDGFMNSKSSTDPNANVKTEAASKRAEAQPASNMLLAAASGDNASKLLYPPDRITTTGTQSILSDQQERSLSKQAAETSMQPQPTLIQTDPDANLLEKIGEEFRDASAFLKIKSDEAGARPEAQSNPARHK